MDSQIAKQCKNQKKRNRIISALSDGILVVEGKYRSGTTITGKYGLEQGKEVFYMLDDKHVQRVFEIGAEHIEHKA